MLPFRIVWSIWSSTWLFQLIAGQKRVHQFHVCAGQTVSMWQKKRGVEQGWELKVRRSGLIIQCNCIFVRFVYLPWMSLPSALQGFVICFRYESEPRSKVHSLQWQSYTEHTHTHTLWAIYCLLRRVCVPLVACKASSCSTYTHSFPLPTPISSPLNGPWGPELSLRLSRTFSSSGFPVWILLIYLWIPLIYLSCLFMYWLSYLCPLSPSLLSQICFPKEKKEKERGSSNPGPAARKFPIWISLQTSQGISEGASEKKMKIQRSSKACNLVNDPQRSTA